MKRGPKIALLAAGALALIGAGVALATVPPAGWTTNDVTTGSAPGYPDLTPRVYDIAPAMAAQFAAQFATTKLGWKVVKTDPAAGIVEIEVPVARGLFTDDLTVTATPEGRFTKVTIRSRSRVGGADFGWNAKHIRALQAAMDDKLPAASSVTLSGTFPLFIHERTFGGWEAQTPQGRINVNVVATDSLNALSPNILTANTEGQLIVTGDIVPRQYRGDSSVQHALIVRSWTLRSPFRMFVDRSDDEEPTVVWRERLTVSDFRPLNASL